jgi:hypothetical protein
MVPQLVERLLKARCSLFRVLMANSPLLILDLSEVTSLEETARPPFGT